MAGGLGWGSTYSQVYGEHVPIGRDGIPSANGPAFAEDLATAIFKKIELEYPQPIKTSALRPDGGGKSDIAAQSANPDQLRSPNGSLSGRDVQSVRVHKWLHGRCDPREKIRRAALSIGLMPYQEPFYQDPSGTTHLPGIRRVPSKWPNDEEATRRDVEADQLWRPNQDFWDDAAPKVCDGDRVGRPQGWDGRTAGSTLFWRHYYQRGVDAKAKTRRYAAAVFGALPSLLLTPSIPLTIAGAAIGASLAWKWAEPKIDHETHLMVTGATWHYETPDNFETVIALAVVSPGNFELGVWNFDWHAIGTYRRYCEALAGLVSDYIDDHLASPPAIDINSEAHVVPI
jgi:hypothetical protein